LWVCITGPKEEGGGGGELEEREGELDRIQGSATRTMMMLFGLHLGPAGIHQPTTHVGEKARPAFVCRLLIGCKLANIT
jgi:hypothetical protein